MFGGIKKEKEYSEPEVTIHQSNIFLDWISDNGGITKACVKLGALKVIDKKLKVARFEEGKAIQEYEMMPPELTKISDELRKISGDDDFIMIFTDWSIPYDNISKIYELCILKKTQT